MHEHHEPQLGLAIAAHTRSASVVPGVGDAGLGEVTDGPPHRFAQREKAAVRIRGVVRPAGDEDDTAKVAVHALEEGEDEEKVGEVVDLDSHLVAVFREALAEVGHVACVEDKRSDRFESATGDLGVDVDRKGAYTREATQF